LPKRADPSSDLLAIGMFAPFVITARLQMLAAEAMRPTARGRHEAMRMVAEKPAAMVHGVVAAQKSLYDSGARFWSNVALSAHAFALTAPALSMSAAARPVRRCVRSNAMRLAKR
jgi:hypothetical protein